MDCSEFERKLDLLVGGGLGHAEEQEAHAHRMQCARCRELLELARGELDILPTDQQEDLAGAILNQTSGSACNRAEDLLCGYIDGALEGPEQELLALHLDHCRTCSLLCDELQSLRIDLAGMAEIEPDEQFVDDVLAATIYRPSLRTELNERVTGWWSRQIRRPRFAVELAYTGAVVLMLLVGALRAPLRDFSPEAIDIARANPLHAIVELRQEGRKAPEIISDLGREAWSHTGAPLASKSKGLWSWAITMGGNVKETVSIGTRSANEISGMLWRGEWFAAWGKVGEAREEIDEQWRTDGADDTKRKKGAEP